MVKIEVSYFKPIYIVSAILSILTPWMIYVYHVTIIDATTIIDKNLVFSVDYLGQIIGAVENDYKTDLSLFKSPNELATFGRLYLIGVIIASFTIRINDKEPFRLFGLIGGGLIVIGLMGYYNTFSRLTEGLVESALIGDPGMRDERIPTTGFAAAVFTAFIVFAEFATLAKVNLKIGSHPASKQQVQPLPQVQPQARQILLHEQKQKESDFCSFCGAELVDSEGGFCSKCGARIK